MLSFKSFFADGHVRLLLGTDISVYIGHFLLQGSTCHIVMMASGLFEAEVATGNPRRPYGDL